MDQTIDVGDTPYDIVVTPDGAYLFIANNTDNSITKIRTLDNTVINTFTVGNGPMIAISPSGSHIYVTNHDDGTVFVVDASQV